MHHYVVQRLAASAATFWGITVVIFGLVRLLPGDPASLILLSMSEQETGVRTIISPAELAAFRDRMGLGDPLPVQYGRWLWSVLHLDLGRSLRSNAPIASELWARLPATLELALGGFLVMVAVALAAGVTAAMYHGRWPDQAVRVCASVVASIPSFWLGLLLVSTFAVNVHWFPSLGAEGPASLVLPALTLGLGLAASQSRLLRASLLQVSGEPFVLIARAKGLSPPRILLGHVLRNALIPVTAAAALTFGSLLGGTVIVEAVFAWPGIGSYVLDAIAGRDYPAIQGFVLYLSVLFLAINIVVDLLYRWLDPRIQLGR